MSQGHGEERRLHSCIFRRQGGRLRRADVKRGIRRACLHIQSRAGHLYHGLGQRRHGGIHLGGELQLLLQLLDFLRHRRIGLHGGQKIVGADLLLRHALRLLRRDSLRHQRQARLDRIRVGAPRRIQIHFFRIDPVAAPNGGNVSRDSLDPEAIIAGTVALQHASRQRRCARTGFRGRTPTSVFFLLLLRGAEVPVQLKPPGLGGRAPLCRDALEQEIGRRRQCRIRQRKLPLRCLGIGAVVIDTAPARGADLRRIGSRTVLRHQVNHFQARFKADGIINHRAVAIHHHIIVIRIAIAFPQQRTGQQPAGRDAV